MGGATFIRIQCTCGYKVFECATKYMGVMSQNALSLIIAPPSGRPGFEFKLIKLSGLW